MQNQNLDSLLTIFPDEFIHLSEDEQKISVQIYRLLAEGQPVAVNKIAQASGLSKDFVDGVLKKWPGVFFEEQKRIIGYWGLALPEMAHRFQAKPCTPGVPGTAYSSRPSFSKPRG